VTRGVPNRLAAMPGKGARVTCASAVAACALLLAACGGEDEGTIPKEQGATLLAQLDAIESSVEAGDCDAAQATADEFAATVNALPGEVPQDVRGALIEASANLEELAADPAECKEPEVGPTDTETTTSSTTETTTSSTTSSTTDETTTDEETAPPDDPGGGPPADTPGNSNPGGGSSDDFEGGSSSGGIGADE
jgi:hypothetical protein